MSSQKKKLPGLIAAVAIVISPTFFISGCGEGDPEETVQTDSPGLVLGNTTKSRPDYAAMTPKEARRQYNRLLRSTLKDDKEVQTLLGKKLAIAAKQQAAVFSVAKGLPGGAELVSAIEAARAEMEELRATQQQKPAETDTERTMYKNERQMAQAKIRAASQQFNTFESANPEIAETRKRFEAEAKEANKGLNQALRNRGYGPLFKAMSKKG